MILLANPNANRTLNLRLPGVGIVMTHRPCVLTSGREKLRARVSLLCAGAVVCQTCDSLASGWGFVFGTSQEDSAGLVWTAILDSVEAPILVFPDCHILLREIGAPRGTLPLKLLVDSTMQIEYLWNPISDTAASRIMTEQIDSVSRDHQGSRGD